jgi:nitrite reductase/ring-hydroxylating ferredoxin subunit
MNGEMGCSRRRALIVLGGLAVSATLPACGNPHALPMGSASACAGGLCLDLGAGANAPLQSVGGAVIVHGTRESIAVVRTSDTEVVAVSAICTHESCIIEWDASSSVFDCPCHGSAFGTTGAVLHGPATRALHSYGATLSGTTITIVGG